MSASMFNFRKLLRKDADSLSAAEEVSLGRLSNAHRQLLMDGGRVNTKSEAGFGACAKFLDELASAARTMHLEAATRKYRESFTINYRALFPDEARNYRVDVLEASIEQYAVIWVNGDKFEFSAEAMHMAEALQRSWAELGALLRRWAEALPAGRSASTPRPMRTEIRGALVALDFAWASFEHKYIAELISIEEKARRLIVDAIEHERRLALLESRHPEDLKCSPEYQSEERDLVQCIARLNSVANFRRKGRDDLGVEVLLDARAAIRQAGGREAGAELGAARVLAADVVHAFAAMRSYLREVEYCLERVDPHLCNNVGLVARLVDWEETWEVATRYVQNRELLAAIGDLVAEIRRAQQLVPALGAMCEECDVELFMVLPRIIWLRYLASPARGAELPKSVLPHRFEGGHAGGDRELEEFIAKFRRTRQQLVDAAQGEGDHEQAAWDLLVKRVVAGTGGGGGAYGGLRPASRQASEAAVEDFMHELERWSIELQRHCPADWNQCSAVLVQCLQSASGDDARKQSLFQV